jgi:hypothetical protein
MLIDSLVMVIADQNGGKSNQLRSIFEEGELFNEYGGYPTQRNIRRTYLVPPDMELFLRLSSWHERQEDYAAVKKDILHGQTDKRRRFKVLIPAQVSATPTLVGGEDLFVSLVNDFEVRRAYAVWLNPDRSSRMPFGLSPSFAGFLSTHREASALAIDGLALHPSAAPSKNSVNARLLCDLLFRT